MSTSGPRLVYQQSFEALMRVGRVLESQELIARLRALGYDPLRPEPTYPPETLLGALELIARHVHPDLPLEQAYERLGQAALYAFRVTLGGKVVLAALGLLDVERSVRLAVRGFRSSANFVQHEVHRQGPRRIVYRTYHSILPAPYFRGIFTALLEASGHREVTVAYGDYTASWRDFVFTW